VPGGSPLHKDFATYAGQKTATSQHIFCFLKYIFYNLFSIIFYNNYLNESASRISFKNKIEVRFLDTHITTLDKVCI
jgi:hypothetical protein